MENLLADMNADIIPVKSENEGKEGNVFLNVVKNGVTIFHAYVGANLLKDRLAFFAELEDCPLEKVDINCLIEPTTQVVYTTSDIQLATAFLLSLFELPYQEVKTLYRKFNIDTNTLRTTELSFNFIIHY